MGFMDKLKALFKRNNMEPLKAKNESKCAKSGCTCGCSSKKEEPVTFASQFSGDSAVAKALIHAGEALDKKVAGGLAEAKAKLFFDNLKAIEGSADADDVKLIGIGQVIGQIFRS